METFIFILHMLSCIFLIGIILLQRGQGADMGAAFGGASQTVFGSRGPATFLNKITIAAAVIFLGASLYLAQVEKSEDSTTVVDEVQQVEQKIMEEKEGVIEQEPAPTVKETEEETKKTND